MTDVTLSQLAAISVSAEYAAAVNMSQIAIVSANTERAAEVYIAQLAFVTVDYEPPYIPRLVPIALPGYTFSGKGYYIQT